MTCLVVLTMPPLLSARLLLLPLDPCRRGSGSSATAASSSSSSQHQVLASSSSSSQQQHKPVTAPLPPRVARLVKTLTDLREDDVHLGTLARTLTKCGFSGTVEEVSGLTKDLLVSTRTLTT